MSAQENNLSTTNNAPLELQIHVSHCRQRFNWDCGICCVMMVLPKTSRQHFMDNFCSICKDEGFNKSSTWTIDLCYLLKRYNIVHRFYTITFGVHLGYKQQAFYQRILTHDEDRINLRFKTASEHKVHIEKRSLELEDILGHLAYGPAIILTNSLILSCCVCKRNKLKGELIKCLPFNVPYQGHYILCIGYDVRKHLIFYRNPSFFDHICQMKFSRFNEARQSFGTDQDTILIFS